MVWIKFEEDGNNVCINFEQVQSFLIEPGKDYARLILYTNFDGSNQQYDDGNIMPSQIEICSGTHRHCEDVYRRICNCLNTKYEIDTSYHDGMYD